MSNLKELLGRADNIDSEPSISNAVLRATVRDLAASAKESKP